MSLYAIGDLHLSANANKPMDVFGGKWDNYLEKLKNGLSILNDDDTLVICGDISWSMDINCAIEDFKYIDAIPGKKIVLKGNHDYWWSTAGKAKKIFEQYEIKSINILHNNFFSYENIAICGTKGYFYDPENETEQDKKILERETHRLRQSLQKAGNMTKYVFLHYPPIYHVYRSVPILELLKEYNVKKCFYGHIHGIGHKYAHEGNIDGTDFYMVSADYVDFVPQKVL